ncbi:MAG: DUF418 domain-containing protein [Tindallia sp. MSAO_Bac2]|nr:MAG: DUF418 domain-containing protein [Tindallia sp. MSAO_Bac2]
MTNQQNQLISPAKSSERMDILDILRGFAIFGILVVNIAGMAGPVWLPGYVAPSVPWYDELAGFMVDFLATGKFYVIFSFLFGFGFSVQMMRAEEKRQKLRSFYPRRLIVLFILGIIHAVFFFIGDILRIYAILGFLLLAFRKRSNRTLVIWAAIFLLLNFAVLGLVGGPLAGGGEAPEGINIIEMAREIYNEGSFLQVSLFQAGASIIAFLSMLLVQGGTIMALFLLGLLAGRMKVFQKLEHHYDVFRKIFIWGLVFGISLNGAYILFAESAWISSFFWIIGAPVLGAAYVSGLCLFRLKKDGARRLKPIANVGRMALTNYLMHSVIGALLFNGYGLGLYERVGAAGLWGITIAVYLTQIPFSTWWLSKYHFGPMEWLWRALTYKQRPPFRKETTMEEAAVQ